MQACGTGYAQKTSSFLCPSEKQKGSILRQPGSLPDSTHRSMALRHRLTTILPLRSVLAVAAIAFRTPIMLDGVFFTATASLEIGV